ncbi:MAG: ATP-binding protein [Cyclobacteriaceae bacterium]|nr:ATP-binding protein [Cyclobacteriaceae bacterium]
MIKIAVTGPESTGKSTLASDLAKEFDTVWVPEYARYYLANKQGGYEKKDLEIIARKQKQLEADYLKRARNNILICDTDATVLKIWCEVKYGTSLPVIEEWYQNADYNLYLLNYVDLPWEYDPLREHPDKREFLFQLYLQTLESANKPFKIIQGDRENRRKVAISAIYEVLGSGLKHFKHR